MNKLIYKLKVVAVKIGNLIYTVYCRIVFLFNKQKTLQKIYEPIITEKLKERNLLKTRLNVVTYELKKVTTEIQKIETEIQNYDRHIEMMRELVIKK